MASAKPAGGPAARGNPPRREALPAVGHSTDRPRRAVPRQAGSPRRAVPSAIRRKGRMASTVSDFMLERLSAWGVDRIYGYPGDGINGILGALDRAEDRFEFVQVPHEEVAAFMACAHAKFTGQVGRLHGDLRPGRDPPAERPLRRQARPPAGGRDRRPAEARRARRPLPAGGRPRLAVQGRRRRVRPHVHGARADAPPRRPRAPHRDGRAHRHLHHRARRRAGARRGRDPAARARHDPLRRSATRRRASCRRRTTCSARPTC